MNPLPFKVKICGVTNLEDATEAISHGANALGLNFYSKSKRCVAADAAVKIVQTHSASVKLVGVFVNQSASEIAQLHSIAAFKWIQLHGDESPQDLREIKTALGLPMLRAFRWDKTSGESIEKYLQECGTLDCLPDAILIDSFKAGEFGGTGHTADWDAIAKWRQTSNWKIPLMLAGGLTPDNVGEAIRRVQPDAVDTASGVEQSPGRKDSALVKGFIHAAREAFAS